MKDKGNRILKKVFIVLILIAISGGTLVYAYLYTDAFKSEKELFAKYLVQDIEEITETLTFSATEELEDKLKQSAYEEKINISATESGKSKPSVQMAIESQNDPINKKYYGIMGILTDDLNEILKLEYMKESEEYSLRFTNAVEEFLTLKNSNLKQFATNLGLDEETIEKIPDSIDFEKFSLEKLKFTDDEINTEIIKYTSLLYNSISKENYTKGIDVVITLNGKTITTNAYILTLNMQNIKNLVIQLLETLKQDEIVLAKLQIIDEMIQDYREESIRSNFVKSIQEEIDELNEKEIEQEKTIKITIYQQNKKTVRIKIEKDLEYITLDTFEEEGKTRIEIDYTKIDESNIQYSNKVTIIKENNNKVTIKNTISDGEEQQTSDVNIEVSRNENNTKFVVTFINSEGAKTVLSRNINLVDELSFREELDNSNRIVLNDLKAEQITIISNALGPRLNTKYIKPLQPVLKDAITDILSPIIYQIALESFENTDFTEAKKQQFNSEFQIYEGTNVSTTQINDLLSKVVNNNSEEKGHSITVSGDIILNDEDSSVTTITGNDYYNVECKIGTEGWIDEIVIKKVDEENSLDAFLNIELYR